MIIKFILFAVEHALSKAVGKLFDLFIKRVDGKQLEDEYENEVRAHKSMFYASILIFGVLDVFIGGLAAFCDDIIEGLICFLVMLPLWLVPVVLYLNLRYSYDSCGFTYRNFFRKTYEYGYWQISGLNTKPYGLKMQMNDGKKIYIFSAIINDDWKMINTILKYVEDKNDG